MAKLYKQMQIFEQNMLPENLPIIKKSSDSAPESLAHANDPSFATLHLLFSLSHNQIQHHAYEQGFQEAKQQTELHQQTEKETLQNLLHNIPCAIEQARMSLKTDVADIVFSIIEQLFLQQPPSPQSLEKQINHLLEELNREQIIKIHLHPEDIARLQKGVITLATSTLQNVDIVAQPTLLPGGCLIQSEHGLFDASLENRFARFQEILTQIKQEHKHANLA